MKSFKVKLKFAAIMLLSIVLYIVTPIIIVSPFYFVVDVFFIKPSQQNATQQEPKVIRETIVSYIKVYEPSPKQEIDKPLSTSYKIEQIVLKAESGFNETEKIIIKSPSGEIEAELKFNSTKKIFIGIREIEPINNKFLYFEISGIPTGCYGENTSCNEGLNSILKDFHEVGGIWRYNTVNREFKRLITPKDLGNITYIDSFEVINRGEFIHIRIDDYNQEVPVSQSYIYIIEQDRVVKFE